jgi:hypothetical protein
MSDHLEFPINQTTFAKMLALKKKMGYDKRGWDEWFDFVFSQDMEKSDLTNMEKIMKKANYDVWYEVWIRNFALNLTNVWNEFSARDLDPSKNLVIETSEQSAIVIGRGPSVKKHEHLETLAKSNYKGSIVCCDSALISALKAGVTPEKFPKYFVATIDAGDDIKEFYDDEIINRYGKQINGIFATVSSPLVVERARQAGIKIHWLHALFDYNEGKKSFNQISGLMVRAKKHLHGLPAIQTGGNIGTSSWFISWKILKCSTIALIGIDHSWNVDDPWEKIISHGNALPQIEIDKNNPVFNKLFPKIYNPEFNCYCILDPIFQYYSAALKEFISRAPPHVNTINGTEGGCIFGERVKCMTLKDFLKKYEK